MNSPEIENIELKFLTVADYEELKSATLESYDGVLDSYWKKEHLQQLTTIFPKGQVVIKIDGVLAGCALSLIVDYNKLEDNHTYSDVIFGDKFNNHDNKGDVLYGIDVFIKPEFRGLRLGRRLYDYRKELCEELNLKSIAFGARIPNYFKFKNEITPKQYIEKVKRKEIHDPVLNFQISNDFFPVRVIKGYLQGDTASNEYAVLMKWENINYTKKSIRAGSVKTIVRLGLIQWQMRTYNSLEELMQQVTYFIDSVAAYRSDFALFPEFFNAPLMAKYNHMYEPDAIRELAKYTNVIVKKMQQLSISYNINIITGSMPELIEDKLYNVGYLCQEMGV